MSLSVGWETGSVRELKTVSFNHSCILSKRCRPSDAAGSELFANVPNVPVQVVQMSLHQHHSDVTATEIAQL